MNRKNIFYVFLLIGISLVVTSPSIYFGNFGSFDYIIHLKWHKFFSEQFLSGDLYPRWLSQDYHGFGSPVFYFYPPLSFYFSSIVQYVFGINHYWIPIAISISVSLALSSLTCFIWLKQFFKSKFSFLGSLIYLLYPFHLSIDLYKRFAFAECWAFVWFPLIMLFTTKLPKKPGHIISVAVCVAGLFISHIPSSLIFAFVPFIYVLLAEKEQKVKTFGYLILSYIIGIGSVAFYLFPAYFYQKLISISGLVNYYLRYDNNFIFTIDPPIVSLVPGRWMFLINLIVVFSLIVSFLLLYIVKIGKFKNRLFLVWVVILFFSVFMCTILSYPIWRYISIIQIVQFPWRFIIITSVSFSFLIAFVLENISQSKIPNRKILESFGKVLILIIFLFNVIVIYRSSQQSMQFVSENNLDELMSFNGTVSAPEYLPPSITIEDLRNWSGDSKSKIVYGKVSLDHIEFRQGQIELKVHSYGSSCLEIRQFFFTGWNSNNRGESHNIRVSNRGTILIDFEDGYHDLILSLEKGPSQKWGEVISWITWSFLLLALIFQIYKFNNQ